MVCNDKLACVMLPYAMLNAVCNNRGYYVSSYMVAVCCVHCASCFNMVWYDDMFYDMLKCNMVWWFDNVVDVMVWYVTCATGV